MNNKIKPRTAEAVINKGKQSKYIIPKSNFWKIFKEMKSNDLKDNSHN